MDVMISKLWVGDRFYAYDKLWTYLGEHTARNHRKESIQLGERGYGYIGDTICSFEPDELVRFVPPQLP